MMQSNNISSNNTWRRCSAGRILARLTVAGLLWSIGSARWAVATPPSLADIVAAVQPKVVKIYGSGGLRGLEAYQSGILISAEGHVLTAWSYVLDSEEFLFVVLDDGQRFPAKLVGHDPTLEIAVLKVDGHDLPHFDLKQSVELQVGQGVLAFSNLFGVATGAEGVSVQSGRVSARTKLTARRGAFETLYRGPVFVIDAMTNNPGAAGGALTDRHGRLGGLLGKELRNSLTNVWLNYAIPVAELRPSVEAILAGKRLGRRRDDTAKKSEHPHSLARLGILLVPDLLAKTPPFVDHVQPGSAADRGGLKPDDLILFVNDHVADSITALKEELAYIDRIDPVRLTVQRGDELLIVELELTDEEAER